MELYFSPYACSMAVRIVADEAGVPLTFREVELYTKRFTEGGADYDHLHDDRRVGDVRLTDIRRSGSPGLRTIERIDQALKVLGCGP